MFLEVKSFALECLQHSNCGALARLALVCGQYRIILWNSSLIFPFSKCNVTAPRCVDAFEPSMKLDKKIRRAMLKRSRQKTRAWGGQACSKSRQLRAPLNRREASERPLTITTAHRYFITWRFLQEHLSDEDCNRKLSDSPLGRTQRLDEFLMGLGKGSHQDRGTATLSRKVSRRRIRF